MALRLNLKPGERVIISGAVVQNGDSRAELLIENRVPILRQSDILSPGSVKTPCERIYLALQLMYVDSEHAASHRATFEGLAGEVEDAAPSCRRLIERTRSLVAAGRIYQAIKSARALLGHEDRLIHNVQ